MSERIRGSYDDALYKSTFILLYLLTYFPNTVFVSVGNTKQPNVYEAANRIVRTGDVYIYSEMNLSQYASPQVQVHLRLE